jgi:hypothetical protein
MKTLTSYQQTRVSSAKKKAGRRLSHPPSQGAGEVPRLPPTSVKKEGRPEAAFDLDAR